MELKREQKIDNFKEEIPKSTKESLANPNKIKARRIVFRSAAGLILVIFIALAIMSAQQAYFRFDLAITKTLQSLNFSWFSGLMVLISWFGYFPQSALLTLMIIGIIFSLGLRWEALIAAGIAVFEETSNALIKSLVHRPRPPGDLVNVVTSLTSYSFPSGHVMYYVAFFGFIWFLSFTLLKKSWLRTVILTFFGLLILLVGLSRIDLGVHWSSDVLGAYLLGTLILLIGVQVYIWGKDRFLNH